MFKQYFRLTKPGIIFGNLLTALAGFFLAAAPFNIPRLLYTLTGLALIIAAGCVCNNLIDKDKDKEMARTKNRALALGLIPLHHAVVFAIILLLLGLLILLTLTNLITALAALLGFIIYVFVYSVWKYRTVHGTLLGSIAGAMPVLVGFSSQSTPLQAAPWILFTIVVLWQMPHFFAIALYRLADYQAAAIPVLPLKRGIWRTKSQMLAYVAAFSLATFALYAFGHQSITYLAITTSLSLLWLALTLSGLKTSDDKRWARHMFFFSLIAISGLCLTIAIAR